MRILAALAAALLATASPAQEPWPSRLVLDQPEVRRVLLEQEMEPAAGTPQQFAELIRADMEKWGGIGRRLGATLNQ